MIGVQPILRALLPATSMLLFLPGLVAGQEQATSLAGLTRRADVVVSGRVTTLESEWDETRTRIRTRVSVAVDEFVKGTGREGTLTLYTPGGEIDGVGEVYSEMPAWKSGEQVVVFAQKDQRGKYLVTGGHQGKLTVTKDERTGRPMVTESLSLEEFTRQVRSVAAEPDTPR